MNDLKKGHTFRHARMLNDDRRTPMECTVTAVRGGNVYYRPTAWGPGRATDYCAVTDFWRVVAHGAPEPQERPAAPPVATPEPSRFSLAWAQARGFVPARAPVPRDDLESALRHLLRDLGEARETGGRAAAYEVLARLDAERK